MAEGKVVNVAVTTTTPPPHTGPARIRAIILQLDRAVEEYVEAQKDFEVARINFQAARERFAGIKRMAHDAMGHTAWFSWQDQHENVRYAAMPIGDAIAQVLVNRAFEAAGEVSERGGTFEPGLDIEEIAERLEAGAFEFQTTSHRREVNAALLQLKPAKRNKATGKYEAADAADIFEMVNPPPEEEERPTAGASLDVMKKV